MAGPRDEDLRAIRMRGEPRRADRRLRYLGRRVGDAVMCRDCDGDGVVLGLVDLTTQPVKCDRCGGEGLEPEI